MKKLWWGVTVLLAMTGSTAEAAEAGLMGQLMDNMSRQEQREQARQREEARVERLGEPRISIEEGNLPVAKEPAEESGPSFSIETIQFMNLPEELDFLTELTASYEKTNMNLSSINGLVQRLNQKLMDKGYVTSQIVVPEQNIQSGHLVLMVLPGRLHRIAFAERSGPVPWENALPIREVDILSVRLLEQGLEQMNRAGLSVTMKLVPSEEAGMTDVLLAVDKKKQLSGMLSVDDSGMEETGKIQYTASASVSRLFNGNDNLAFSGNLDGSRDGYRKGTRGESISYSIPNGKDTYSLRYSHYQYHQTVPSELYSFISTGKTHTAAFTFEHVMSRTSTERRAFEASVIRRTSHTFLNDMEIGVQAMDTTALELALSDRIYLGEDTLYLRLSQKTGTGWFGAMADTGYADGPKTHYRMYLLDADYQKPFTMGCRPARYTGSFHGQWTAEGTRLYSVDAISIGNRYTVWGFDGEYTLMGESGWYVRNELASAIPALHSEVYIGLDAGSVYGPSVETLVGRTIAGMALGVRGSFPSGLSYDVFLGRALYRPEGYHTRRWAGGLTISCRF